MRFSLRVKLFLVVFLGVVIPMALATAYLRHSYRQYLEKAFVRQGRVMVSQVLVTRRWMSRYGGIWVPKLSFVQTNPYLHDLDTVTVKGDPITLRSPDMVTRELSELAAAEGLFSFRITSDTPINPANAANPWEREWLGKFDAGAAEGWAMRGQGRDARFQYIAPLRTEASCLRCHQEWGYRVGEVRGGISVEFPVGELVAGAAREDLRLALEAAAIGAAIILILWLGASRVLLRPLSSVRGAIGALAAGNYNFPLEPRSNDELGDLARALLAMREQVRRYSQSLEQEVAVRTHELDLLRGRAQSERDYLINLFERMADGVCVASGERHDIQYINPSLAATLGDDRASLCRSIFEHAVPLLKALPETPDLIHREVQAPGGRVFDVIATELQNTEGPQSWLLVFRDITIRKQLEEMLLEMNRTLEAKVREQTDAMVEREKLATLGEVSAGLAHEIRNPLSAILSGISLLETSQRTPAERDRILQLIKREAGRLNASLTDFLLFARPQEPHKVRIDLGGLIREIVHLIEDDPGLRGEIEIVLDLREMPPVWFDDDQLRQVIWNVALNALQAMKGKGRLTFRTSRSSEQAWRLEIEDTGQGIPDTVRDRIYDPFFSTKKEGTGLGLSIVRRIVAAHGGTIRAESPAAGGARFVITAPWETGAEPN